MHRQQAIDLCDSSVVLILSNALRNAQRGSKQQECLTVVLACVEASARASK